MTELELREWLFSHVLCGCGSPDLALEAFHSILRFLDTPHEERDLSFLRSSGNAGLLHLTFYHLDNLDLSEHGANVTAGWLTPEGKRILSGIDQHGEKMMQEFSEGLYR